jgi:hypothetical protein
MKQQLILFFGCAAITLSAQTPINDHQKIEIGFLDYGSRMITVDPSSSWRGYYLPKKTNGVDLQFIQRIQQNVFFSTGIGVGYAHFQGNYAMTLFSEVESVSSKRKIAPILSLKLGYMHLWNQYPNGTGTGLMELGVGLNYKRTNHSNIYLKSGFLLAQQVVFIPFRLGFSLQINKKKS